MTQTGKGYLILVAALGMTAGLIGAEFASLTSFHDTITPAFVGKALIHISTVVAAFVGGKLIPTE